MKFQNKTIYDRRTLEKMNQTVNWAVTKKANVMNRTLVMVIPLAIFGSGFYLMRSSGPSPIAIAELILGGFLMIWIPFGYRFQAFMASKLVLKDNPVYTIDFDEKGYVVSSTTTHGAPTDRMKYDTFWRLCETMEYFVLMLDKRSGYILNKNGFTQGDEETFRTFIEYKTDLNIEKFPI